MFHKNEKEEKRSKQMLDFEARPGRRIIYSAASQPREHVLAYLRNGSNNFPIDSGHSRGADCSVRRLSTALHVDVGGLLLCVRRPRQDQVGHLGALVPVMSLVDHEAVLGQVGPRHRPRVGPQQEEDVGFLVPDFLRSRLVTNIQCSNLVGHKEYS